MFKIKVADSAVEHYRKRVDDPFDRRNREIRNNVWHAVRRSPFFLLVSSGYFSNVDLRVGLSDENGNDLGEYGLRLTRRRRGGQQRYDVVRLYEI